MCSEIVLALMYIGICRDCWIWRVGSKMVEAQENLWTNVHREEVGSCTISCDSVILEDPDRSFCL